MENPNKITPNINIVTSKFRILLRLFLHGLAVGVATSLMAAIPTIEIMEDGNAQHYYYGYWYYHL